MTDHDAFGRTRGTRGIDHMRHVIRSRTNHRRRRHTSQPRIINGHHRHTRTRKPDGTWEKFTTPITLDKTKKYIVAFLDKTRNDEDGQQFLYEANLSWNNWKEVGYCTIRNDHVAIGR